MEHILEGKELAELLFKTMNRRDFSLLEPYLDKEVAFDFPGSGRIEGYKRVLIFLKALLRKYPVLVFSVNDVIVGEDKMCAIWTNEGRDIEGTPYSNSGNTVISTTEGKITFISDYFKDTSFTEKRD